MDAELSNLAAAAAGAPVISVGADIVDIARIRRIVVDRPAFVARVFTERERRYCESAIDSAERFAARFAAKEAGLKALGVGLGGADFHDFEVIKLETGEPQLVVVGRAKARASELGIGHWLITLSHSDLSAFAVVLTTR